MKRFIFILIFLTALLALVGIIYYTYKGKEISSIPTGYSYLFSLKERNLDVSFYSQGGELKVGKNKLYILINPERKLTNLYFYMPPMPGMGEMREDVVLNEVKKGRYEGVVNISMAGSWQVVAEVEGNVLKKELSVPFKGSQAEGKRTEGISVDPQKLQMIGIQTVEVGRQDLMESFHAVGYISYDLSKTYDITLRSDAWVLDTFGRFEGELISKGTPLMKILSPDVEVTKEELRLAKELGRKDLEKAVLEKLSYLREGEVIRSPYSGVILERRVSPGGFLKAGDVAYKIANVSSVWVIAEIPQEDAYAVKKGMEVLISPEGIQESYTGRVDYVFPEADKMARTVKVRISLPNRNAFLKINQLVDVYFEKPLGEVLAVPESAVVDTGKRQVVFVELEPGVYQPRAVRLGRRAEGYYEVLEGLKEGERVVVKGTFLLDSEAQIKGIYEEEVKTYEHHH
ncbi:efflux RND transporter periplasmic adaptor subunit [Hydrogenobacter thermophilus]|uniref:efflux RND transporter periplasmic adaptor subunit n=1 Tax=Hydrogenobacter thermophilus TaxID=940 RepID=UPI0030F74CD2